MEYSEELFNNSMEIYDKIENYSLSHNQTIPTVTVKNYPKDNSLKEYPVLHSLLESDDIQDRYWVNECLQSMKQKNIFNEEYLTRLEEEADIKKTISEKLETNMFKYPNTLSHYVNMFWAH